MIQKLQLREEYTPSYRVANQTQACSALEVLAVIIGGPRQIESAEKLLTLYGSLPEIDRATVEELTKIPGISKQVAERIKAAARFNAVLSPKTLTAIDGPASVVEILSPEMSLLDKEHFRVVLLSRGLHVIGVEEVYKGCVDSITIRVAEIIAPAIRRNASQMIVAHNHPSGDPTPSPEDVQTTRQIRDACKLMDIDFLDHLIIGRGGRWISLKERGLGFN
jgi:DNA repair protein RadC